MFLHLAFDTFHSKTPNEHVQLEEWFIDKSHSIESDVNDVWFFRSSYFSIAFPGSLL